MLLSSLSRVLCLALCGAGLLQAGLEWIAWTVSARVLQERNHFRAREAEQALFLLALAARLGPWLLVSCFLVPAYVRGEDNRSAEHVSFACVVAASCVFFFVLVRLTRSLTAAYRAHQCCRQCRVLDQSSPRLPMLVYPGERSLLAVAGVFSPKIIVSELLDTTRFSAAELDVAFAHEAAHVRHRDNLKLFLLSLFPYVPLATKSRPSLQQRWRLAAELAADEEGAQGESGRSFALAQMLVTMAREASGNAPRGLIALSSAPEHLRARVERLLATPAASSPDLAFEKAGSRKLRMLLPVVALTAALTAMSYFCLLFGHRAAEFLLHLG